MPLTLKRRITVLATVISSLLIAGVVFAAFTANGEGAGTAASFAVQDSSLIAEVEVAEGLWPGHSEDLQVSVTNHEDFPVQVDKILAGDSDANGDCLVGMVTTPETAGSGDTLNPGSSETYTIAATLDVDATNDCEGIQFNIPLNVELLSVPELAADAAE